MYAYILCKYIIVSHPSFPVVYNYIGLLVMGRTYQVAYVQNNTNVYN